MLVTSDTMKLYFNENNKRLKSETMIRRALWLRPFGYFFIISLFVFLSLILIPFESSTYFKCNKCSLKNLSTTTTTTTTIDNFYENLNNTEDEKTSVDDNSIWCLHMAQHLENERHYPPSPILRAPSLNSTRLHRLPYRYSLWNSSSLIPRALTSCEHDIAMRLLMVIERICRKNEITFMLTDGSLLGSLRHHDIIPWDDDIDIMIPFTQSKLFVDLILQNNQTLVQFHKLSNSKKKKEYYKIFFKNTPSAGGYSWNFPFIDIFVYMQNKTHIWQMGDPDTAVRSKYIFPLAMRPFGQLWLPAPRKPKKLFDFDPFDDCKSYYWNHKKETGQNETTVKCKDIQHIYPFVQRDNQSTNKEFLRTNHSIIHTVIY